MGKCVVGSSEGMELVVALEGGWGPITADFSLVLFKWLFDAGCTVVVRWDMLTFFFYFEGSITAELESYSQEDGYSSILEPIEDSGWLVAVTFRNGPTFLENTNSSDCLYTSLYPDWSLWMS